MHGIFEHCIEYQHVNVDPIYLDYNGTLTYSLLPMDYSSEHDRILSIFWYVYLLNYVSSNSSPYRYTQACLSCMLNAILLLLIVKKSPKTLYPYTWADYRQFKVLYLCRIYLASSSITDMVVSIMGSLTQMRYLNITIGMSHVFETAISANPTWSFHWAANTSWLQGPHLFF